MSRNSQLLHFHCLLESPFQLSIRSNTFYLGILIDHNYATDFSLISRGLSQSPPPMRVLTCSVTSG